jgi:DNA-binding NarL/FixJ family response regulator
MTRLMIVADHSLAAHAIRLALRQTAGFRVVGYFDGRGSIRQALAELEPEVVLIDDMQQSANALTRIRETAEGAPQAKSLLLTLHMDDEWLDEAFAAGVDAIVSKSVHPVSLGTLLREICHGNVALRHQRRGAEPAKPDCPLTDRELEILRLVAEGYTNGRIAAELWVTEQTVKFHLSNTYRKLGVANRTEASRYAHLHALTAPAAPAEMPRARVA